ncbi:hypothetical protein [Nonomuraea indica]|uniref:hypothetical protein n=1 Tax=Nonomuraea indica TaxID=1581193 RepID=UPI000C7B4EF0|nr:hypothetical protein [Nonomuraea indica]
MIATPGEYAWLTEAAADRSFTYVRGLTPEQVVSRRSGRPDDFAPMTYEESVDAASRSSGPGVFIGLTVIGDCSPLE